MAYQIDDQEGRTILQHGVMASVYEASLFKDITAMRSVASQDNMNALTTLSEREIDAWFKVDSIFNQLKKGDTYPSEFEVGKSVAAGGFGILTEEEWKSLIRLRAGWPSHIAELFKSIHFVADCSHIRVKTGDFDVIARMDGRYTLNQLCVLCCLFIETAKRKGPIKIIAGRYTGREDTIAKSLSFEDFEGINAEPQFNNLVEDFIMELIERKVPSSRGRRRMHKRHARWWQFPLGLWQLLHVNCCCVQEPEEAVHQEP